MIRSVFRTIELSQGYVGYLATHEGYVAGLDTLPLFLGIVVYTVFWPPAILTPATRAPREEDEGQYNEMASTARGSPNSEPLEFKQETDSR
jgi:hypothetical protein